MYDHIEEPMKDRIILILGVISLILFIGLTSSCNRAYQQKIARDKEMASRLDLEEKMNKFLQEKTALEDKLRMQEKRFQEEKSASEVAQKALLQEQLVNQGLREELSKVSKAQEASEEGLAASTIKKSKK
jgi:hypothetical protein